MPEPLVRLVEVACQHFATRFVRALCLLPSLWQPKNPPARVNLGVRWPSLGRFQVRVRQASGPPRGWIPHFLLDLVVRPQPAKKRTASLACKRCIYVQGSRYSKCPYHVTSGHSQNPNPAATFQQPLSKTGNQVKRCSP